MCMAQVPLRSIRPLTCHSYSRFVYYYLCADAVALYTHWVVPVVQGAHGPATRCALSTVWLGRAFGPPLWKRSSDFIHAWGLSRWFRVPQARHSMSFVYRVAGVLHEYRQLLWQAILNML